MNARKTVLVLTMTLATVARSGHEVPVYPSYYPHEIEIATVGPERAAGLLAEGRLHAHVGGELRYPGVPPDTVRAIESLGSIVIVRVNPASPLVHDDRSACTVARAAARAIAAKGDDLIAHPYPVTPFHGDYLHHVDLADAAKARTAGEASHPSRAVLKVRASDAATKRLVPAGWLVADAPWDVEVAEVGVSTLIASATVAVNGWLGPSYVRTGWFHAHRLLGDEVEDAVKARTDDDAQRLRTGAYGDPIERINLARTLVSALAASCRAIVAGYTVKREYFNAEFAAGIENIGYDALDGFASPIFLRTVKLKDFPWNGWLALGTVARPVAAWNPIAGFTDPFGRLMWFAVGDPALIPSPYEHAWMINRISDAQAGPGLSPR